MANTLNQIHLKANIHSEITSICPLDIFAFPTTEEAVIRAGDNTAMKVLYIMDIFCLKKSKSLVKCVETI